jgi:hypothetical protein
MRRLLWVIPAALAVAVAAWLLSAALGQTTVFKVEKGLVGVLVAAACWRTAAGFERGDYLRRAWILLGAVYAMLAAVQVLPVSRIGIAAVVVISLVLNGLGVAALVHFALAHRVAGLVIGSRGRNLAVFVGVLAVALVIDGWPMLDTLQRLRSGDFRAAMYLVSSAGDLAALLLIAPIFLTALALRGGLLLWPWALLAASTVSWLVVDAEALIAKLFPGVAESSLDYWSNGWQMLACFLALGAAEAQRRLSAASGSASGA